MSIDLLQNLLCIVQASRFPAVYLFPIFKHSDVDARGAVAVLHGAYCGHVQVVLPTIATSSHNRRLGLVFSDTAKVWDYYRIAMILESVTFFMPLHILIKEDRVGPGVGSTTLTFAFFLARDSLAHHQANENSAPRKGLLTEGVVGVDSKFMSCTAAAIDLLVEHNL